MNELLTADPVCFDTTSELKALLDLFGPTTGRYHLSCPIDWHKQVEERVEGWDDIKKAKANTILRRAIERGALIARKTIEWDTSSAWIVNVERIIKHEPNLLKYVIVDHIPEGIELDNAFQLDDLHLPTTEEEKIQATPSEFNRVSRNLLIQRTELLFIDPFLNPCDRRVKPVLQEMMGTIANGRCESLMFWVRDRAIESSGNNSNDVRLELEEILYKSGIKKIRLEFITVDDRGCKDKLHARYLLSLKGGIRFDQGFQTLQNGVTVDVSPIGANIIDALITTFIDGINDLRVVDRIYIKI